MIKYVISYVLLIIFYLSLLGLGIRGCKRYLSNEADFRIINYVQFLILATFLTIEAIHYLETGDANQMCILLTRNFFVFVINSYLNCRLLGYRNVYTKRSFRNILYIINNTLVFMTINLLCSSFAPVMVQNTLDYSNYRIIQVLNFMGTDNYTPKYMAIFPVLYCIFAYSLCLAMDRLERRAKFTKFMTFIQIIPLITLLLDTTNYYDEAGLIAKLIFNSLYFLIPSLGMMYEALSIIYFSKKNVLDDDIKNAIDNAFKENYKKITNSGKVQAKLIAKEIQKDENILWTLPKGKRYESYRMYIINLLEDPE